jgi:hypothetical protein
MVMNNAFRSIKISIMVFRTLQAYFSVIDAMFGTMLADDKLRLDTIQKLSASASSATKFSVRPECSRRFSWSLR